MKQCLCFTFLWILFCSVSFSKGNVYVKCNENGASVYKCTSNDKIVSLPVSRFEKRLPLRARDVTELDLSENRLNLVPGCFGNFSSLKTLILSKGGLSYITADVFKGLDSLTTLDLSNNALETLPSDLSDVFNHLNHPVTVHLQNNNWDCSCSNGLVESLKSIKNLKFGSAPAMCVSPNIMKQMRIDQGTCDVNECMEENDCDDEAECLNTIQDYTCTCTTKGFKGSGKECIDINECEGENDCAKIGGKCINEHGKYRCECEKGFRGDGKACRDIDECATHDCGEDGECTNSVGSFKCDCDEGYKENKDHICVDIDECKIQNHTCIAIKHSYCSNLKKLLPKDPGYECLCESGYRKVGKSCVLEGNTTELMKILSMIIGGFLGSLFLIIVFTLVCRKLRNRETEEEKEEESTVVMAPGGGMPPPMDFACLDMPQVDQEGREEEAEEEWGELEEEEDDDDDDDDDDDEG